jgi:hypothetical protein
MLESIISKSVLIGNFFVLVGNCFVILTLNFGPVCTNRSISKKFPIKTLLEMIDSSERSLGEVEYDKQNWLQYRETRVRLKIQTEVHLLLLLFKNLKQPIPKNFPIKTISERTHSSIKNLGQVESVISKSVLVRNIFVMDQFIKSGNRWQTSF